MSKIKNVLGGIASVGLAIGGLVMAGKSGFGKKLGDPCNGEDPLKLDDLGEIEEEETEEITPDDSAEEETE